MTHIDPPSLAPTRDSLLSRLKDWNNQDSWTEFFNTYWKLIYSVARKAGLDDEEAQDAVQETVLSVAKEMANFKYDKSKGTFKGWLKVITKRRVADILRKRYKGGGGDVHKVSLDATGVESALVLQSEADFSKLDNLMEIEWQKQIVAMATERVRNQCQPQHFQIFELHCVNECPAADVAKLMKVSRIGVHVISHRVKKLIKLEVARLAERV